MMKMDKKSSKKEKDERVEKVINDVTKLFYNI